MRAAQKVLKMSCIHPFGHHNWTRIMFGKPCFFFLLRCNFWVAFSIFLRNTLVQISVSIQTGDTYMLPCMYTLWLLSIWPLLPPLVLLGMLLFGPCANGRPPLHSISWLWVAATVKV